MNNMSITNDDLQTLIQSEIYLKDKDGVPKYVINQLSSLIDKLLYMRDGEGV